MLRAKVKLMKQASVPLYIRFGEIPENGKSGIYASGTKVGEEVGLSVYKAIEANGLYFPLLPEDANESSIADYFDFLIYQERKVYLLTGDVIRFEGQGREPLLQNHTVLKDITHYYRNKYTRSVSNDTEKADEVQVETCSDGKPKRRKFAKVKAAETEDR